ncbi:MAG TPA: thioesterase family protein [Casimicrobiaceae bacterium]|nr:thioesterase family protein [Casimicrobiaceae bacterium]
MPTTHVTQFTVEFGDCDPAQIVFYPNFFRWMDAASLHFFAAAGIAPWHRRDASDGIVGTPLVDAQASFSATATYGDRIEIETSIVEWRNTSFVMRHLIRRGTTLLAEGREVRIFAQRHPEGGQRLKAVRPPADIRRRFE